MVGLKVDSYDSCARYLLFLFVPQDRIPCFLFPIPSVPHRARQPQVAIAHVGDTSLQLPRELFVRFYFAKSTQFTRGMSPTPATDATFNPSDQRLFVWNIFLKSTRFSLGTCAKRMKIDNRKFSSPSFLPSLPLCTWCFNCISPFTNQPRRHLGRGGFRPPSAINRGNFELPSVIRATRVACTPATHLHRTSFGEVQV
jgi:hypothetical protein